METEKLIELLARDAAPVPRRASERRLGTGIAAGSAVALLGVVALVGVRPDLAIAVSSAAFWAKAGYLLALGCTGMALTLQLARPEGDRPRWWWLPVALVLLLLAVAVGELAATAPAARVALIAEPTWKCLPLIAVLTLPVAAGLGWAFRRLAPTRLRAAGAATGLAAAGFAAACYSLACQEMSATFLLTRYALAIALIAAVGGWVGPRLLKW